MVAAASHPALVDRTEALDAAVTDLLEETSELAGYIERSRSRTHDEAWYPQHEVDLCWPPG